MKTGPIVNLLYRELGRKQAEFSAHGAENWVENMPYFKSATENGVDSPKFEPVLRRMGGVAPLVVLPSYVYP